jgi:3',5'-cyclic-AMP phosphodiesterase
MNHKDTNGYLKWGLLLVFCLIFLLSGGTVSANATEKGYLHLVILGDPHLPGKNIEGKERVIQTINSWEDADIVIPVGDICEDRGTTNEYAAVKTFFAGLKKPIYAIAGNHDFIYEDLLSTKGTRVRAGRYSREAKLRTFRETFGMAQNFYSKKEGNYLLVFLSPEESKYLAEMSQKQVEWLGLKLEENKKIPTIVFFHAPLENTLRNYNNDANTPNFFAQPSSKIQKVLSSNPQVFLWVSGHTHTPPKEESFASAINVYEKRITNIHNTDMNRERIWTNSLFLYPDKIIVKTYDHKQGAWLPKFERSISAPVF